MLLHRIIYTIHEKAFGIHKVSQKELAELAELDEDTLIGFKEDPIKWLTQKERTVETVMKLERAAGKL